MKSRLPWYSRIFQGLWSVCLVAIGLSSIACAQGPDTVVPAPRDGRWMDLHNRFVERAKQAKSEKIDLLFLGDSITQGWNNNEVWKRFYGPRNAANFGIGGDRTQHVLWRIQNGELDGIEPKVVVLMIGTNNASSATADEIAQGVTAIVKELRQRLPESKILLLGVFPRGQKPDPTREKLQAVNEKIARLDDGSHVKYLDIGKVFLERGRDDLEGDHARLSAPDPQGLPALGRRHGADALVDAGRAAFALIPSRGGRGSGTPRTRPGCLILTGRTGPRA